MSASRKLLSLCAGRGVTVWARCAIEYTIGHEEEYANGSKGDGAEQEKPTGKKIIKVVEIGTEEDEGDEEAHQGENVA